MKTKEKILETLLKIQELVESIADKQHMPKGYEYDFTRDQTGNGNDLKPVNEKPFPRYWWTYTEGLPDIIKDWFNENHKGRISFNNEVSVIAFTKEFGFWYCDSDYGCEYVTHQQIIDHYGLEVKSQKVNLMDYTKKEEVKIEPDEQPKKLYTKEEIVNLYDRYLLSDNQPAYSFARWLRDNL